jgi:hypothetical protein
LQKFAERINITVLRKIISPFIVDTAVLDAYCSIDSTGFKVTHASGYYTERVKLRKRRNIPN